MEAINMGTKVVVNMPAKVTGAMDKELLGYITGIRYVNSVPLVSYNVKNNYGDLIRNPGVREDEESFWIAGSFVTIQ